MSEILNKTWEIYKDLNKGKQEIELSLHFIKLTHQLSFRNIKVDYYADRRQMVLIRPQTLREE